MDPFTTAAAIKGGTDLVGSIFGGSGNEIPRTPYDQRPMRRNMIGLQNYLLGFSPGFTPYDRNVPGGYWGGQLGSPYQQQSQQLPAYMGGPMQRGSSGGVGGMPIGGLQGLAGGGKLPQTLGPGASFADNYAAAQAGQLDLGSRTGSRQMPGGYNPVNSQGMSFGGANYGMQPGGGFSTQLPQGPAGNDMLGRYESVFGPLGTPTTALQQQSLGGISQFLNSNPYGQSNNALQQIMGGGNYDQANDLYTKIGQINYGGQAGAAFGRAENAFNNVGNQNYFGGAQNAFNQLANGNYFGNAEGVFNRLEGYNPFGAAQTSMEQILATNPGLQGMEALRPLLDRNLAAANQTGGRFGSANAILRSRAVDDNNLLAAQMYQRGIDQQIGAAGQYGAMGNSLIGARGMAGQGLLGVGQGRMNQQANAAQGMLGVGQGRLSQGLGAAQGLLGVGQGQLGVGQLGLQAHLGSAGGLAELAMALSGNQLNAAGQMANNQNMLFGNMTGAYDVGSQQARQEAERQQQALALQIDQMNKAWQQSMQGRG